MMESVGGRVAATGSFFIAWRIDMGRIWFWLQRKKRIEKRACGQCCLNCRFYKKCRIDGKF